MTTKKAEDFFYEHAGHSFDPKRETPEQGRRRGARQLAEAEQWAKDEGYDFVWRDDDDPLLGDVPEDEVSGAFWVAMEDEQGDIVQSLGSVLEGHDERANRRYRRVVEAELALEEMVSRGLGPMQKVEDDLAFINLHRARMGQRPLDPVASGWEPRDIETEARRLRGQNPRRISWLQGAVSGVLAAVGISGIWLGRRKK